MTKEEVKTTTCYMCACRCGIKVHIRDGQVRYIQGNPDHPLNKGILCAKGSSGIMKQYSPARLKYPMLRKKGSQRGEGDFEKITWDEAYDILEKRLSHLRETDPKKFAFFTGRDQMQALTGLFAKQFGTPNFASHGGFCSVNMATAMIYSIGGSFWEFGGPDLERAKFFLMIGTAEDHHSNPLKAELSHFKRNGGRFVSVNPVRSGYAAVADEWLAIKPGSDAAFFLALIHVLIKENLFDRDFVTQYTNGPDLVGEDGLFVQENAEHLWWNPSEQQALVHHSKDIKPTLQGSYKRNGETVKPSFELLREQVEECTPEWATEITGISAETILRIAREMGDMVENHQIELPIAWTDVWGNQHESVRGTPIAFHAMRGLAAHSNGFQTIRALSILMSLLGTIDAPGGFRHKAPFPKHTPPGLKPPNSMDQVKPNTPLGASPLGFVTSPEDLFVDNDGEPCRIDKAFSWEHPFSSHGMMQNVIANAWRGDPYPIDTLFFFMANMAWNSSMNTAQTREMLVDQDNNGEYKIPFIVVSDAFESETVQFADLVLPDTTYLERHDVMSMLDRPISEFDGPVDSVRVPVLPPYHDCRPFQEVIVELGSRLKLPAFVKEDGSRKYKDYPDFIVNFEASPGVGFLSGFRGENGDKSMRGEPNPKQWEAYANHNCFYQHKLPESHQYMRNFNQGYLEWASDLGFVPNTKPIMIQIYCESLQHFRLAAEGKREGRQPPERLRKRIQTYFDPLPFYYPPVETEISDQSAYPLSAITQRPMAMYHSWDSQNAWQRQIHAHNYLYVNTQTALAQGIQCGDWVWVESAHGKIRCMCKHSEAVEPGTVWTWNAIGKAKGAWNLSKDANESQKGFLLNHLIPEALPAHEAGDHMSNSDPITGQAAWYDLRVRISKADSAAESLPQFKAAKPYPGQSKTPKWIQYIAGKWRGK